MKIGQKIRDAREDRDMTQKDMAEQIPMNQSNYSKIERDLQEPNLEQLKRIVEILDLDIREVLDIHTPTADADARFGEEVRHLYRKIYRS